MSSDEFGNAGVISQGHTLAWWSMSAVSTLDNGSLALIT